MPENIEPIPSNKAKDVRITDAGGYYTGTQVEAALQEIGSGLLTGPYWLNTVAQTGLTGNKTGTANLSFGAITGTSLTSSGITPTYVIFAGTGGLLTGDASFTYSSTTDLLTVQKSITISGGTVVTDGFTLLGKYAQIGIDATLVGGAQDSTLNAGAGFDLTTGRGFDNAATAFTFASRSGAVNITTAHGGDNYAEGGGASSAGNITFIAGIGGSNFDLSESSTESSGQGGGVNFTAGAGGATSNTVEYPFEPYGGTGGTVLLTGGTGGALTTSGTGQQTGYGGAGSAVGMVSGIGGAHTDTAAAGNSTKAQGGAAGNCTLTASSGGLANGNNTVRGGSGGNVSLSGGSGGGANGTANNSNMTGGQCGSVTLTQGQGGYATANRTGGTHTGGSCGALSVTGGQGGAALYGAAAIGGNSGNIVFAGGTAGSAGSGTTSNLGGSAGTVSFTGGQGGVATGVGGATATGGGGSAVSFQSGNGGIALSGTTNRGGNAGDLSFIGGRGGTGATSNGTTGNIIFAYIPPSSNTPIEYARFDNNASSYKNTAGQIGSFQVSYFNSVAYENEAVYIDNDMVLA